tara:strand:+ start:93 stop:524 length:432 start_codon:yes stop_codon:yes gene_type:complete
MLLTCSSCNSRYLVNSADLKPNGRNVKCAACGYEWFYELSLAEKENLESLKLETFINKDNQLKQKIPLVSNLPSTYIKENKPSTVNSFFAIIFILLILISYVLIKKENFSIIAILYFYLQEFFFNIKLIVNDLTKLINQIVNY